MLLAPYPPLASRPLKRPMMISNFNIEFLKVQPAIVDFIGWTLSVLLWTNILALLLEAPSAQPQAAQVDIPNEVWSQYPLIAIGVILVGWLARQWVINEREWRTFTTQQVADKEAALLRTLQLIQANNENLHKILLDGQAEQLRLQREGLKETFDAELERVLDLLAKANSQPKRGRSNDFP